MVVVVVAVGHVGAAVSLFTFSLLSSCGSELVLVPSSWIVIARARGTSTVSPVVADAVGTVVVGVSGCVGGMWSFSFWDMLHSLGGVHLNT